jgi:Ca2+-binding RTX toxin-like protein
VGQAFEWDESLLLYGADPLQGSSRSYTLLNTDGTITVVRGTSFTYNALGQPTGGTITSIDHLDVRGDVPVLLERITDLNTDLGTLATLVNGYTSIRDQIAWFDQIDQTFPDPVVFTDTSVRWLNRDGTFTEFVGTGLLAAATTPFANAGVVTEIRHLDSGGNPIAAHTVTLTGANAQTALGITFDSFLSEITFRNGVMAGGATYSVLAAPENFDNLDVDSGISGGAGDDHFVGLAGGGTFLDYEYAAGAITASLVTNIADGDGHDTFVNIQNISGSQFDDSLTGNGNDNVFDGREGNDTINSAGGNDTLIGGEGNDSLNGGTGIDTARYQDGDGEGDAVTIDLRITTQQNTGGQGLDTLVSIENVVGSNFGDSIIGNFAANTLWGMDGNDTLDGGSGNDTLIGGAGADSLTGGIGADMASYAGSDTAVTVSLASGTGSGGHAAGDTLSGIECLQGSEFNDTLTGSSLANTLDGGNGNDVLAGGNGGDNLNGGIGNDTASFSGSGSAVTVDLGAGTASGGHATGDSFSSIESLTGSIYADSLTGSAGANTISGGNGDDTITGGIGTDVMTGGGGADDFRFVAIADSGTTGTTRDRITGFVAGSDDIDLSVIDAVAGGGDDAFAFLGTGAFTNTAGQVRFQQFDNAGTANDVTIVYLDQTGDGVADSEISLTGLINLTSNDFVL